MSSVKHHGRCYNSAAFTTATTHPAAMWTINLLQALLRVLPHDSICSNSSSSLVLRALLCQQ
jgi:hypothetical protein